MNRASSDASTKRRSNLRGFYEATLNERSGVATFSLSRRIMAPFAANGKVTSREATVEAIKKDWNARRQIAKNVKYRIEGEVTSAKGCFSTAYKDGPGVANVFQHLGDVPAKDVVHPCSALMLIDFSTGRFRLETHLYLLNIDDKDFEKTGFYPSIETHVFDGNTPKVVKHDLAEDRTNIGEFTQPRQSSTELVLHTQEHADAVFIRSQELPTLLGHGYVPVHPNVLLQSIFKDNTTTTLEGLNLIGQGVIRGKKCLILRTKPTRGRLAVFREYWVDPSREAAIVLAELMTKDYMLSSVEIEYEKTDSGWLPKSWLCYEYLPHSKGAVSQSFHYKVSQRILDPGSSDADFDVSLVPGMLLVDNRNP